MTQQDKNQIIALAIAIFGLLLLSQVIGVFYHG